MSTLQWKNYADLSRDIKKLLPQIDRRRYTSVCGIPRSGMVPASMLAFELGLPLSMLGCDGSGRGRRVGATPNFGRTLVVDDSVYKGGAMAGARAVLGASADYACVYVTPGSEHLVDFYAEQLPGPRYFQWNVFGIHATRTFMFDMDGVLCVDPVAFDDDGPAYVDNIANAQPLHIPTVAIKAICTNRIERHRGVTEAWLDRHGVRYGELIMQPFGSAAERRELSDPATFKAQHYGKGGYGLYVESHKSHAANIARLARRPVLSVETWEMIHG